MSYIATRTIVGTTESRGTFDIRICIGMPFEFGPDEWACPVALEGLHVSLGAPHGEDSFQALMLAQKLARQLLTYFVEDGGALYDAPGGTLVSITDLFDAGIIG
jgi:hypothetical protein